MTDEALGWSSWKAYATLQSLNTITVETFSHPFVHSEVDFKDMLQKEFTE